MGMDVPSDAPTGPDAELRADLDLDGWTEAFDLFELAPHVLADLMGEAQRMATGKRRPCLYIPPHRLAAGDQYAALGLLYDPGVGHRLYVMCAHGEKVRGLLFGSAGHARAAQLRPSRPLWPGLRPLRPQ